MLHFSTNQLPERDRLAGLREILGRKMSRLEFEPLTPTFHADVKLRAWDNIGIASVDHSLMRVSRTRELLADGEDALVFQIPSGGGLASQLGREVTIQPGDAVLGSNADVGTFICSSNDRKSILVQLSRRELLLADFDAALMRRVPGNTAALRLLTRYVTIFDEEMPTCRRSFSTPRSPISMISRRWRLAQPAMPAKSQRGGVARTRDEWSQEKATGKVAI